MTLSLILAVALSQAPAAATPAPAKAPAPVVAAPAPSPAPLPGEAEVLKRTIAIESANVEKTPDDTDALYRLGLIASVRSNSVIAELTAFSRM